MRRKKEDRREAKKAKNKTATKVLDKERKKRKSRQETMEDKVIIFWSKWKEIRKEENKSAYL